MKRTPLTNPQMCEIVTLRTSNKKLMERGKELEKYLTRAANELETMSSQYGDDGSKYLIDRIREVLGCQ